MASPTHRRSRLGRRTALISTAAVVAAGLSTVKTTVNWTPALTAGLQASAKNLPAELAATTGAGVLTDAGTTAAPKG